MKWFAFWERPFEFDYITASGYFEVCLGWLKFGAIDRDLIAKGEAVPLDEVGA